MRRVGVIAIGVGPGANMSTSETSPARAVKILPNGRNGEHLVVFGCWSGIDFAPSHARPARSYKSRTAAERAAMKWIGAA